MNPHITVKNTVLFLRDNIGFREFLGGFRGLLGLGETGTKAFSSYEVMFFYS